MAFMYLEIWVHSGKTTAKVVKQGITPRSLGTAVTRNSNQPIAVFAIDGFEGLEVIDTNALWDELFTREPTRSLMQRFQLELSDDEITQELRERLKYKPGESK